MKKPFIIAVGLAAGLSSAALAQRPLGVDVYAGSGSINWSSVKSAGISFAWAKATEGYDYYEDANYASNMANGKAAGLYMGAYHFAHAYANTPDQEAGYFWAYAKGQISNDGKTMQPVLDFEVFTGCVGAGSYTAWANQWTSDIVSDGQSAGLTLTPVLYTSSCDGCNFGSDVSDMIPWIADYNGESAQTGSPWSTCGSCDVWNNWTIWQCSSTASVSGISGYADLDVFNGDSSSLVSTLVIGAYSTQTFAPGPQAVSWGNNRIDVVCRGGGDIICHKWWDGTQWNPTTGFEHLGGVSLYGAAISATGVNRLDVFCVGTDYALYHRWYDGTGWYPNPHWENVGGTLTSSPAAVSWGPNRIDVVARGGGNIIVHKWWDGTQWNPTNGWEHLGGTAASAPAICSWASNRLDVFYQGTDNALWHNYNDGSWHSWQSLGGTLTSAPSAVSWGPNRIDVVARGGSNIIVHKYWDGSAWQPSGGFDHVGGNATSDPGISSWGVNRLDVFCRGTDDALWHDWYTGSWNSWQSLGGYLQ